MAAGGRPQPGQGRFSPLNMPRNQTAPFDRLPSLMQQSVCPPNVPINSQGTQPVSDARGAFPQPSSQTRGFARGHSVKNNMQFNIGRGSSFDKRGDRPSQLPRDYIFAGVDVQSRFPNPKEKLHNILQFATKQHKGASYTHRYVDGQYWQATVHVKWPHPMSFSGEGFEKKEAERRAAAVACVHLITETSLKVSGGGGAVSCKKDVVENEDQPRLLHVDDRLVSRIESLLQRTSNMGPASNRSVQNVKTVDTGAPALVVKDVFTGSPLQPSNKQIGIHTPGISSVKKLTEKLPVANFRQQILRLTGQHQVIVISGETGCGKTTQIPQFILDEAVQGGHGSSCNIVVTQPRRIVAMSIAERVAYERGEVLGRSVGYQVRLEGVPPTYPGRILFCTTGILLRRIQNNPLLQGVSHVIVDEVHERDINTDFLLILLKELISRCPYVKVVVMSATVDATRFCGYFNNCPLLNIPGFTHPVTEYFLDDIKRMLHVGAVPQRWVAGNQQGKRLKPNESFAMVDQPFWGSHPKRGVAHEDEECPEADPDLVTDVIVRVSQNLDKEGAILCFLAGWDEITTVNDMLTAKLDANKTLVLPLHSMLPMGNQRTVFERPPPGVRKIVLATNIAETSITIDDVAFVVNAGNLKEKTYDVQKKVSCLTTHWTSRASVIQRRGRAGRCKPGYCYNLFTRNRYVKMEDYQQAEMLRMSLEEIVLQAKIQRPQCSAWRFLSDALDPPSTYAVQNAVGILQEIGALDDKEALTPLGQHMANLPVDPRIGKMIIYGTIFRCLDPILTIAASLGYKDPFVSPLSKRAEADKIRHNFACDKRSDHVAMLNAFQGWQHSLASGREMDYVFQHFLHRGTLNMIKGMKEQFYRVLQDAGLVPPDDTGLVTNAYANHVELVKAILCAGVFPNVIKIGLGLESKGRCGRTRLRLAFKTKNDGRVVMHPSSVNSDEKSFNSRWLVYHDKVKSSQVYIRDSSMVHPISLVCFAGKNVTVFGPEEVPGSSQTALPSQVTLAVDGDHWMSFRCSPRVASMLQRLRQGLDNMISQSIIAKNSASVFSLHTDLIEAVCELLNTVQKPYHSDTR